jgi:hypothetical protein
MEIILAVEVPTGPTTDSARDSSRIFARAYRRVIELLPMMAGSAHGPSYLANSYALARALHIAYFASLGLPRLVVQTSA